MGLDDANDRPDDLQACVAHMWVESFEAVTPADQKLPDGTQMVGFGTVNECQLCGAIDYEPSNFDQFADTGGLDPRVYPKAMIERARTRVQQRRSAL